MNLGLSSLAPDLFAVSLGRLADFLRGEVMVLTWTLLNSESAVEYRKPCRILSFGPPSGSRLSLRLF